MARDVWAGPTAMVSLIGESESRARGNNAGPPQQAPHVRLNHGLAAPKRTDVGRQPPIFIHAGRHRRSAPDLIPTLVPVKCDADAR